MASLCTSRGSLRASYLNHDHCQAAAASRFLTVSVSLGFFPGLKKLQICSIAGRSNNSPDFDAAVLPCNKISFELHTSHYSECRFSSLGCDQPKRQKKKKKEPLQINLNIFIIICMSQTVHISYRLYLHIYQVVSYYSLCTRWSNELVF